MKSMVVRISINGKEIDPSLIVTEFQDSKIMIRILESQNSESIDIIMDDNEELNEEIKIATPEEKEVASKKLAELQEKIAKRRSNYNKQ